MKLINDKIGDYSSIPSLVSKDKKINYKSKMAGQTIFDGPRHSLKKGIWIYFLLLIFEGALRKWILPELATPLLVVRDPIAIWLLVNAYKNNFFEVNRYIGLMILIGIISFITTLTVGHGNISVAIYGERILLLHFPLIFVIGSVFTHEDIIKMGKAMLWLTLPMTILITIQFYSPQSAWINRGIGGDISGGGFNGGALGYYRPSGTFSFTTGLGSFFSLSAAYILYFWIDSTKRISRWLLFASSGCLLAAIPFSISRTLLFSVILSALFLLVIVIRTPKNIWKVLLSICCFTGLILILSKADIFQTGIEVFSTRFTNASEFEGGIKGTLGDRFLGGLISAITRSGDYPFWGLGVGMGTNAGAKLLTGSAEIFLISEGEWGRLIGEMGLVLGLTVILIRIHFCIMLVALSLKKIKEQNFLPWMLLSFGLLIILQGQWAQPTSLGFAVLSGGLIIAALKKKPLSVNKGNIKA